MVGRSLLVVHGVACARFCLLGGSRIAFPTEDVEDVKSQTTMSELRLDWWAYRNVCSTMLASTTFDRVQDVIDNFCYSNRLLVLERSSHKLQRHRLRR